MEGKYIMKKQNFALLLAFTLTIGIMPFSVFAADNPSVWSLEIVNAAIARCGR
jgi:hypothetical protein